ncbi:MAG: metallophosphoesterase [Candidatus Nanopelagicales bacterium]|nr:metallophosphoesterase [Candidatus Nanopelagicales bacterium]MCU0299203.1 metallophosphoesterase [Candidatus Nanopelagicales bacterium]
MHPLVKAGLAGAGVGMGTLAYALWEARQFTLRSVQVQVLRPGSRPVRILQLTDLHLTPTQTDKMAWVRSLAAEDPDFVILTGDLLGHMDAVPYLAKTLEPLRGVPGVFVFGSNDYWSPKAINPFKYFVKGRVPKMSTARLPTDELESELLNAGWSSLNNARGSAEVQGNRIDMRGVNDPHIQLDRYHEVAGGFDPDASLRLAVTHAPYLRVLDPMADDGADLIIAGHTHGGQVCLPGYGALVTNCDLDSKRAKGLSRHQGAALHVSAGLGTNPYAPVRLACPPEATMLHLVPKAG